MKKGKKNNHDRQTDLENFHLELFSKFISLPGEQLPRQKNQKPDFIFRNGGQLIGIEHTEIFETESKLKGTQRQIIERAQDICSEQGIPPLSVLVNFNDFYDPYPEKAYPKNGEAAVNQLVETICSNLAEIEASDGPPVRLKPKGPFTGISGIWAQPGKARGRQWLSEHRWGLNGETGWVTVGFISELQSAIDGKNAKINTYLQHCDECWLLIVADRSKADQKYKFTDEMKHHCFKSSFHRTFFFEVATPTDCVELTTEN